MEKVVIPYESCPAKDIISHLRDILSQIHYNTKQCVCCDWVVHEDNKGYKCSKCEDFICENCYDDHGNSSEKIFCENCEGSDDENTK